ncbi:hypothetical protein SEA_BEATUSCOMEDENTI_22 [Arthrobacter phage BeatusComedenti]|uniref:Uncharacterized protein n=1 Tax=Arthrobacter phage BeatusComedenti TaxID=2656523 RepID=A0A649VW86_9CAUD|nr:hypothetical protein SEA_BEATUSCOMEDENTI_22 [Arthrobacter phage BeatusComedenti]
MGKKPVDQKSKLPGADGVADTDIDLEADADEDTDSDDDDEDSDDDSEDDDDADEDDDTDGSDVAALVAQGIQAAMPALMQGVTSEIDRRINSAISKTTRKGGTVQPSAGGGSTVTTSQDLVRGARMSFREYLPGEIKLLSNEERKLATDYANGLLAQAAAKGFDDDDATGREVAEKTAAFLKSSRKLYTERTKKALERSGALKPQTGGQSGGTGGTTDTKNAAEAALARRQRLGLPVPTAATK